MTSQRPYAFAAIDFGTAFSGWAYSFKYSLEDKEMKPEIITKHWNNGQNISWKTPTCAVIDPNGKTLVAFGYDAEDKYLSLAEEDEHNDYYYFKNFKMLLYKQGDIRRNALLRDVTGKQLQALKVFELSIRYLKDDLLEDLQKRPKDKMFESDIFWALTVPAIWSENAKKFMREAAIKAGIDNYRLTIVLEPECASIYYRQVVYEQTRGEKLQEPLRPGEKYVIIDCGGGTVDVCCHEINADRSLREIYVVSGNAFGGTTVDKAFEGVMKEVFGEETWQEFQRQCPTNYIDFLRDFEIVKRKVSRDRKDPLRISFPVELVDLYQIIRLNEMHKHAKIVEIPNEDLKQCVSNLINKSGLSDKLKFSKGKLNIAAEFFKTDLYEVAITGLKEILEKLFQNTDVKSCESIILVGGLGESYIIQDSIKMWFPNKRLVIPNEAGLAVLKGAVVYGFDSSIIAKRIVRYTYGKREVVPFDETYHNTEKFLHPDGVFRVHAFKPLIHHGETIPANHVVEMPTSVPVLDDQRDISVRFYAVASENPIPRVVDHPNCIKLGRLVIPVSDLSIPRERRCFTVKLKFGGTEISAEVKELSSGRVFEGRLDFLG